MLEFELTKYFGKGKRRFLIDVKAALPTGKIIGVFGPSGAGKSSLLRLLSGLEKADNGFLQPTRIRIYYDGIKWMDINWKQYIINESIGDAIFE